MVACFNTSSVKLLFVGIFGPYVVKLRICLKRVVVGQWAYFSLGLPGVNRFSSNFMVRTQ